MGVKQKQRVYLTNEDSTPSEKTFIATKVELGYNSDGTLSTKVLSQEELTPPQAHDPIELNHDKVVWLFNELARDTISSIGIPVAYHGRTDDGVVVVAGDQALEQLKGADIDSMIVDLRDRFATYLFDEGVEDDRAVEIAEEVINEDFLVVYRSEFLDAIKSACADGYDQGLRYYNTKDELQKELDEGTFPPREDLNSLLNGDTAKRMKHIRLGDYKIDMKGIGNGKIEIYFKDSMATTGGPVVITRLDEDNIDIFAPNYASRKFVQDALLRHLETDKDFEGQLYALAPLEGVE